MLNPEDVRGLVEDISTEQQFVERNEWLQWAREILNRKREPKIPGLEQLQLGYHSPKPMKDAHSYTNRLVSAQMRIQVAAQAGASGEETMTSERRAQKMENFFYRLFARWLEEGAIHKAVFDMVALKRGSVHIYLNRDVLPIIPQQEKGEDDDAYLERAAPILDEFSKGERTNLIELEHLDPATVFWTPDDSHRIIAARVPLNHLARQYAQPGAGGYLGEPGKGKRIAYTSDGEVEVTTAEGTDIRTYDMAWARRALLYIVESDEYIYHYVCDVNHTGGKGRNGQLIGCYKNVFGTPGIIHFDGEPTGQDHALFGRSALIEGLYETEPLVSALGKLIMSAAIEAAQQQRTLEPLPGPEGVTERQQGGMTGAPEVKLLDNKFRLLPRGYRLSQYTDELPADVLNAWAETLRERENYGFPKVLGQPEELDANSGYDRAKATDAVSSQLDPPLERIGNAVSNIFRASASCVKELGIDIPVRNLHPTSKLGVVPRHVQEEITITPDDIIDVDISVRFDAKTQYAKLAETEEGLKLVSLGFMSETHFMTEVLGYDDPDRVRREITRDKVRKIAADRALQDATALFNRVLPIVEGQAVTNEGLDPVISLKRAQEAGNQPMGQGDQMGQAGMAEQPMAGAAAAARQPMREPTPPAQGEMGATGAFLS